MFDNTNEAELSWDLVGYFNAFGFVLIYMLKEGYNQIFF